MDYYLLIMQQTNCKNCKHKISKNSKTELCRSCAKLGQGALNLPKHLLIKYYNKQHKSLRSIGKIFKCDGSTVLTYLKKYSIKRRSQSETNKIRKVSNKTRKLISLKKKKIYKLPHNNPNWRGGISFIPYTLKFNKKLKLKIRKRDNYTCQNCGIKEKAHIRKNKRVLAIHHINYDKQNSNSNNLITLCNICNCKANSNKDYWFAYYTYLIKEALNG